MIEGIVRFRNRMPRLTFLRIQADGAEAVLVRLMKANLPTAYPDITALSLGDRIRVSGPRDAHPRLGEYIDAQTFEVIP